MAIVDNAGIILSIITEKETAATIVIISLLSKQANIKPIWCYKANTTEW